MVSVRMLLLAAVLNAPLLSQQKAPLRPPATPVVLDKVCPTTPFHNWKIDHKAAVFSSWKRDRKQIAELHPGEEVTLHSGVLVAYEPDQLVALRDIPEIHASSGDKILRYGVRGEDDAVVWVKGRPLQLYALQASESDGTGFQFSVDAKVIHNGIKEWWVRVTTSSGKAGWVLGDRQEHGAFWYETNFGDLCSD